MNDDVTIEFLQTIRAVGIDQPGTTLDLKTAIIARIYPVPKGRGKPIISLVADDYPSAAQQVAMWFEKDRPTMAEARAQSEEVTT